MIWRLNLTLLFILCLLCFFASYAQPHGGGIDRYGCHNDRKQGNYHCHKGPLAGHSFASQRQMLKKLDEMKKRSKDQDKNSKFPQAH